MEVFIFILFFIFFRIEPLDANFPLFKCNHSEPDIRFPFRVLGQYPLQHVHSPFDLFCKLNKTTINFPAYGDLVVKSISYDTKRLNLLDPKNCVPEVFLNLDLSLSPFSYYYTTKTYTYLNCSSRLLASSEQVPCLSGSDHHVYVVDSISDVPVFCKPVKTVSIPFSYSPYLSDNSFGLGLTWDLDSLEGREAKPRGASAA